MRLMEEGCPVHSPRVDADCRSCQAIVGYGGINASSRRLCTAALKWADASARDPEAVETETRELRETLLDKAWAYRQACLEYADTLRPSDMSRGCVALAQTEESE